MTDHPMLYSAPMVRGLLREAAAPFTGKRQTRRLSKDQPPAGVTIIRKTIRPFDQEPYHAFERRTMFDNFGGDVPVKIKRGDRIWVREEFSGPSWFRPKIEPPTSWPVGCDVWYWADGNPPYGDWTKPKRSMHMPRWMSRLTLTVTDVRIERLHDISEADCVAEGIEAATRTSSGQFYKNYQNPSCPIMAYGAYRSLWNHINGDDAWEANPWVVAYTFTVQLQNIDQIERAA
jgi:hypothetical protein